MSSDPIPPKSRLSTIVRILLVIAVLNVLAIGLFFLAMIWEYSGGGIGH